jgi:hypothetical protein
MSKKASGGRPPKFDEPSRPVTLTLPESTLRGLNEIDADRAQAIVKLTHGALGQGDKPRPQVEIVKVADNTGLLVIGPCRPLSRVPFLHLVEVAPGRFLLALKAGNSFSALEVAVQDLLEELNASEYRERSLLMELLENVKKLRRAERVSTAEILFVRLE